MLKRTANTLSAIMVVGIIYTVFCLYQALNLSTEMILLGGYISNADGQADRSLNTFHNVHVKRGERITLRFRVPSRDVAGWTHTERHLIDFKNTDYIVATMKRTWKADVPFEIVGEFPIPRHVHPGCGAVIYSQTSYSIRWNILSWVVPLKGASPKVTLCIE